MTVSEKKPLINSYTANFKLHTLNPIYVGLKQSHNEVGVSKFDKVVDNNDGKVDTVTTVQHLWLQRVLM